MKKTLLMGIALLVLFLTGCGPKPSMSIDIDYERVGVTEISPSELAALIASGDDFILYISKVTCESCAQFRPFLDQFIAASGFQVYKIESDESTFPTNNSMIDYQFTPSIVMVENGEVLELINSFDDPKPFSSVAELEKYLLKYVLVEDLYKSK
ncbi:MAG: thioredoxin family protein [Bacillus subtilis]|nr:thioredoxin family protein [Bacillus subtilis]